VLISRDPPIDGRILYWSKAVVVGSVLDPIASARCKRAHGGQTLLFGVVGILAVLVIGAVVLRIPRGTEARTEG
jgi:hypothetical protein